MKEQTVWCPYNVFENLSSNNIICYVSIWYILLDTFKFFIGKIYNFLCCLKQTIGYTIHRQGGNNTMIIGLLWCILSLFLGDFVFIHDIL